jgi:YD repeat-containing protein
MQYDGLDRLLETDSLAFGGDGRLTYTYDALDNLKSAKLLGVKQLNNGYDPLSNRLISVTDNSGNSVYGFNYDLQGNLSAKNAQGFTFDYGNRLRSSEVNGSVVEAYRYDAYGRRVTAASTSSGNIQSLYGQDGVLRYQVDERTGKSIDYIYLGTRLVARVSSPGSPGAPTVTTTPASYVSVGNYSVQWTARAGATSYELQESTSAGAWQSIYTGSAVSRSITGKTSGPYSYRARACNGTGCSAWSATTSITVALAPTTAPSISVPSTGPNGSYTVIWSSVSDASSYTLQESTTGTWATVYSGANLSNSFSGKAAGSYAYRVMACNATGCGPLSNSGSVQVFYAPASAPVVTSPSANNNGAYGVSWTSISGATSYRLEEALNGGAWSEIANTGTTSVSLTGRSTGTYSYRARACNAAGCGPYSGVSVTQVTFPPSSAPALTVPSGPGPGSYTVSWTSVATATTYALEESANGSSWDQIQNASAVSYTASGKPPGSYAYRVTACNVGGCGPTSSTAAVTVLAPPATPVQTATFQPIGVVPPISTRFNISWTLVSGATSYESQSSVGNINYTGPGTSYNYTQSGGPLINGVIPQFRVRACNAGGCSAWSAYITPTG